MAVNKELRAHKLKKFHMVLCGAGVGNIASRGLEEYTGGYSLMAQLVCMVVGLALAAWAVRKLYKPKIG